jgi:S-DNA-T family DNA segregation ATPase FtsK/SpoIIIE
MGLAFDFFYRFYADMTDALMGKQVFIPNIKAMFDKQVSLLAYIHRLDVDEEKSKKFKEEQVTNITDFLKSKIQKDVNIKKYLETVATKFISAKTMNYKDKKIEERIKMKLAEHGMGIEFDSKVVGGPVTLYKYEPSIGIKMKKIESYVKDIEQVVGVSGIRILAPIPNSDLIGFEIPNKERTFTTLGNNKSDNLLIGLDIMNNPIELIVEEMPHLLVAGTTGSGKSVFLNTVIKQCKSKYDIEIIDPKGTEFDKGMSDHIKIAEYLNGCVETMKERYAEMKKVKVKKWSDTGKKSLIIIIDEYNDLCVSKDELPIGKKTIIKLYKDGPSSIDETIFDTVGSVVSRSIKILSQKARAAGIHIFLATQRPSIKVIDGDIKANFPTRICFKLPTATDSKVVIDTDGADKLLGKGDGLLLKDGSITRFQAYNI